MLCKPHYFRRLLLHCIYIAVLLTALQFVFRKPKKKGQVGGDDEDGGHKGGSIMQVGVYYSIYNAVCSINNIIWA